MRRLASFFAMLLVGLLALAELGFAGHSPGLAPPCRLAILFGVALGASVVTLVVARLAWCSWTYELERALTGNGTAEFQPLLRERGTRPARGADRESLRSPPGD